MFVRDGGPGAAVRMRRGWFDDTAMRELRPGIRSKGSGADVSSPDGADFRLRLGLRRQPALIRVLAVDIRFSMDGPEPLPRQHLHRTAVEVAEVRGHVPARTPRRAGRGTDHRDVGRLLQRRPPALVVGRADAGQGLPRWSDNIVRTIRRDPLCGAQPAQPRLRAWRDRRAPVPSAFPSGTGPDGKTEAGFKPGSGGHVRTGRPGGRGVPRTDALAQASTEITEGSGDHGNPP